MTAVLGDTGLLPVRVHVSEVWDELPFEVPATTTVAELKRRALAAARVRRDPDGYVLKFRGFEVLDEARSLADAGIVPNAALVVVARRRRPVR